MAIDNGYDAERGDWVTTDSRYQAVADESRFATLDEDVLLRPDRAWPLLLALLAAVPEDVVDRVGCGPLETFIHLHGAAFAAELEREARENPRFREAVLNVELRQGALPAVVEARLRDAFGVRFELLPADASSAEGGAGAPAAMLRFWREPLARRRLGAVGERRLLAYCARSPARSAAEGHALMRSFVVKQFRKSGSTTGRRGRSPSPVPPCHP